jgi:arylsulfatase A-like enzyme
MTRPLILALTMLALGGCAAPDDALDLRDANVLLIVIDTLGAEHVGAYAPGLDTTPRLDALADGGVVFERAFAAAPWTQPSMAALLTGLYPSDTGVTGLGAPLPDEAHTLAEAMHAAGRTGYGVVSHLLMGSRFGWAQGLAALDESAVGDHASVSSPRVTDRALALLRGHRDTRGDEPFFMLAHYFDPHFDYLHHPDFDRTSGYRGRLRPGMGIGELRAMRHDLDAADIAYLVGLYHEEIAFTDHHVGRLLDGLAALGLADDTLVIVTADHGEEFMRHGWIGHTLTLHDELIHVPMIWSLPGRLPAGRVAAPVSLVDVVPTLAAGLDLDLEAAPAGVSLLPLLADPAGGSPGGRDLFAEVSFVASENWPSGGDRRHTAFKTAIMAGDAKLVHDVTSGTWQAWDRGNDPFEMNDRYREDDPALLALRRRLGAWEAGRHAAWGLLATPVSDLDDKTKERLKSLGYVH